MDTVLTCLRGWQREAADRYPSRENLILPDREHSLLNDNGALERFLCELLRISDDVHIERWLADIVQDQNFVEKARHWRSFRLIALWLICVFRRGETVSQLREILGERGNAHRILDDDSKALDGTYWKGWFDAWTEELRLRSSRGPEQRFVIGSALRHTAGEAARITVIIPSYNHEAFVGDAIRSVLGQTKTDFQLLIVDDASQDGTVSEAEKVKDSRIRVRSNPENLGLGLSLARALDDVEYRVRGVVEFRRPLPPAAPGTLLGITGRKYRVSNCCNGSIPLWTVADGFFRLRTPLPSSMDRKFTNGFAGMTNRLI